MTPAEKLATLQAWEAQVKAISAVYEADRLACGAEIDSPRWEAVYGMLEKASWRPDLRFFRGMRNNCCRRTMSDVCYRGGNDNH